MRRLIDAASAEDCVMAASKSSQQRKRVDAFRLLLVRVSEKLDDEDVEKIGFIYRVQGEKKNGLDVLRALERRRIFSATNTEPLVKMMRNINRLDIEEDVKRFLGKKGGGATRPALHVDTVFVIQPAGELLFPRRPLQWCLSSREIAPEQSHKYVISRSLCLAQTRIRAPFTPPLQTLTTTAYLYPNRHMTQATMAVLCIQNVHHNLLVKLSLRVTC